MRRMTEAPGNQPLVQYVMADRGQKRQDYPISPLLRVWGLLEGAPQRPPDLALAICSFAAATICSGVKPNFRCNSLSGADAPNVCMAMQRPAAPW
jgi:hypothetical protein